MGEAGAGARGTPAAGDRAAHAARNVVFSLIGFIGPVLLLLLTTPPILRGLGDAAFGVWAMVGNVLGYFTVFNALQTASTKYLAEYVAVGDADRVHRLLGTSLAYNTVVGVLGGVAIWLLADPLASRILTIPPALQAPSAMAFRVAAFGFLLGTMAAWGAAVLAGLQRYGWLSAATLLGTTFTGVGGVAVVRAGYGVVGVAATNVAGTALTAIVYAAVSRRLLGPPLFRLRYDQRMLGMVLSYGAFSTLQVVFGVLITQLDRTLLGAWVGVAAVTIYSVPMSMAVRIHQLSARALEVVFPIASTLQAEGSAQQLRNLYVRAQTANTALATMAAVPLFVFAAEILGAWIGADFAASAAPVFRLLIVAYAIFAANVVPSAILSGLARPGTVAASAGLLALGNLVGYVALIPRFGALGAAAASAIASLVCIPPLIAYVGRLVGASWRDLAVAAFARPLAAGAVAAGALTLMRPLVTGAATLVAALLLAPLAYAAASVLFGVWTDAEWAVARRAWARVQTIFPIFAPSR